MSNNRNTQNRGRKNNNNQRGTRNAGSYKNRKDSNQSESPASKCESYDKITTNDISWWNKATELYERATNVAFARQAGVPVPVTEITGGAYEQINSFEVSTSFDTGSAATLPMGQLIEYVPTIGVSNSDNSAPNRAFQAMASAIYSKTTGSLPFPQYVLGLMNLAVQSIAQNIALVKRALDTSYSYAYSNTALPRVLLEVQGIDPDSVLGKQNDVVFALDDVIRDFNALHFPSYMDAFKRHYSLARNIWWDAKDPKAQFFIFRPYSYLIYSDLGNVSTDAGEAVYDGVARCVSMPMPYRISPRTVTTLVDVNAILNVVRAQIGALKNSDDYWTVRGAMGRVFTEGQFMTIDAYTPAAIDLTVDQNMLWQIANFDYAGAVKHGSRSFPNLATEQDALDGLDILGDPVSNILICEPKLLTRRLEDHQLGVTTIGPIGANDMYTMTNTLGTKHSLNSQANEPTKEFVMEATRLKCAGEVRDVDSLIDSGDWFNTDNVPYVSIQSCGTELVVGSYLVYLIGEGDNPEAPGNTMTEYMPWTPIMVVEPGIPSDERAVTALELPWRYTASTFYLRSVELFLATEGDGATEVFTHYGRMATFGDIFNYTYITTQMLNNLHRAALLSAYTTDTPVGN